MILKWIKNNNWFRKSRNWKKQQEPDFDIYDYLFKGKGNKEEAIEYLDKISLNELAYIEKVVCINAVATIDKQGLGKKRLYDLLEEIN